MIKETTLDYQKELEIMRFVSPGNDVDGSILVIDYKRVRAHSYVFKTHV